MLLLFVLIYFHVYKQKFTLFFEKNFSVRRKNFCVREKTEAIRLKMSESSAQQRNYE